MKSLKFDHHLAQLIISGAKRSTWRMFDDKDLSVDDKVVLIDKVDPRDRNSWQVIGEAVINKITQKRLGDITPEDMNGHESFGSVEQMYATYRKYYGNGVGPKTPVKLIEFIFSSNEKSSDSVISNRPCDACDTNGGILIYADGGSRGNPGPSASGYVLMDRGRNIIAQKGEYLGITTNNQAEYQALKFALEDARARGIREAEVYMDSMLVVNQMKGSFKVRNRDLWPIHEAVVDLVAQFKRVTFSHIPRELNKLADAEVNKVLDEQMGVTPGVE